MSTEDGEESPSNLLLWGRSQDGQAGGSEAGMLRLFFLIMLPAASASSSGVSEVYCTLTTRAANVDVGS